MRFATRAIHAGQPPDPATGAVTIPIHLSTTFAQESPGKHKGYEYSRVQNPTRAALEECLASLEEGGKALAFASGCAASTAVLTLLSRGDRVIAGIDLYGGTRRLFKHVFQPLGICFEYVDTSDIRAVKKAMTRKARMVWVETPGNPNLSITDIRAVAELTKKSGAWLVVDNTFATPYLTRPLTLGADIVIESCTKYLGGHSDLVGGAVVVRDESLGKQLAFYQKTAGAVPSPFDCWLLLRGIKTLPLRVESHCANAQRVAEFLAGHRRVKRVSYPGLANHPGHQIAREQMRLFGGMVSFELKGSAQDARKFVSSTKLCRLAESLGGVESLIQLPSTMSHASLSEEERRKAGISDSLVRLSVGIEDVQDIIEDLDQALSE